ncbi:MAG: zinc-binding dehydrogenase [Bacillota bacterium]|jgi:L-iditol 2-dehydrogenase
MKALVKTAYGKDNCDLVDLNDPTPTAGELLIQVEWVGICGTDQKVFEGTAEYTVPVILGHELAGTVIAAAQDVEGFQCGDRVIAETSLGTCGKCESCRAGFYNVCKQRLGMGRTANGAFAKLINIPYHLAHKIPDALSTKEAALCEPAAATHHAVVERGRVQKGEKVWVFGPGPIGMLVAQIALAGGAWVLVSGLPQDEKRLQQCQKFGCATVALSPNEGVPEWINHYFGGEGADVVFECSGSQQASRMALEVVKPRGRYVQLGLFNGDVSFPMNQAAAKEIHIMGSYSSVAADFEAVLRLAGTGKIDLSCLITKTFLLEDWRDAFLCAQEKSSLKVLLHI